MSIWMKWAVPSVLEVFSATFVLNRWIWLFRQSVIFFKNFKILSDFDAPAKKYFIFYDKIPFRPRPTFSVPFRLNFSPDRWPNSAQNWAKTGPFLTLSLFWGANIHLDDSFEIKMTQAASCTPNIPFISCSLLPFCI